MWTTITDKTRALLGRLPMWRKLALFGLLGIAMALPPLVMYLRVSDADIGAARVKLAGIAPAAALQRAIQLTQQHRGLSAGWLAGNEALAARRQDKQAEVERALAEAGALLARELREPRIMDRWAHATENWQSVARAVAGKAIAAPQSFAQHTAVIAEYLDVLDGIADHFGLALDPEPDSHPLTVAVLSYLPQLTESLGQIRAKGTLYLFQHGIAPQERAQLAAQLALAREQYRGMRRALDKLAARNPALAARLAAPLKADAQAAEQAFAAVDAQLLQAGTLSFDAGEFFQLCTAAIDAQFALGDRALAELGDMLRVRVAELQRTQYAVLSLIALVALAAALLGFLLTRAITQPIHAAVRLAQAVASGDLSTRVEVRTRDEMGQLQQALLDMNGSLVNTVSAVQALTGMITTASCEIAQGSAHQLTRTEGQAASLEETAASMEQLTATVRQNADNAHAASDLARSASEIAERGGAVVDEVVLTMGEIHQASARIADITGVIEGIAFQTNILALNAAVEAARAGEQGRGFAVVAGEVRSLARRSAEAAKEIKTLIGDSTARVETGSALVAQAGRTMGEILGAVRRVTGIMSDISSASGEQSSGIEQVNQAVNQMERATQENSTLVGQSVVAAESMRDQAGALARALRRLFRLSPVSQVVSAQGELAGIAPARLLLRVIQLTQQHRGLCAGYLGGNLALAGPRRQKQAEVEQALAEADALVAQGIADAGIVARWQDARRRWAALAHDVAQKAIASSQSLARHTALIAHYLEVLDQTADHFGLAQDPEADSHPLTMAALFHLPNLTESLGQARARGTLHLFKKSIGPEDRSKLAALIALGKVYHHNARRAIEQVAEHHPALRTTLAAAVQDSSAAAEAAFALIERQVIAAQRLDFDSAEFFRIYTGAIDSQFSLTEHAMEELTALLDARAGGRRGPTASRTRALRPYRASVALPLAA